MYYLHLYNLQFMERGMRNNSVHAVTMPKTWKNAALSPSHHHFLLPSHSCTLTMSTKHVGGYDIIGTLLRL